MRESKIVVLGCRGVGKSALTVRFVRRVFTESHEPTIEDCYRKTVDVGGEVNMLEILDTAGTSEFAALRHFYLEFGHGFVLVYSVTSPESLEYLRELRNQLVEARGSDDVPVVVVANKSDSAECDRAVSREEGRHFTAQFHGASFYETSVKDNVNVEEIFHDLIGQIQRTYPLNKEMKKINKKKKLFGCCVM